MTIVLDEKEIESLPLTVDPDIVCGTPVFSGTRVPIDALITNLEAGLTLDEFLDNFPSVTREQTLSVVNRPLLQPPTPQHSKCERSPLPLSESRNSR